MQKHTNRNPVKSMFVTWPKTPCTKSEFHDHLLAIFSPSYGKIVQEAHADGTPHLHAIIQHKNKYSCPHFVKKFKELYPNDTLRLHVKPIRSLNHAIKYLHKEDPQPITFGTIENASSDNARKLRFIKTTEKYTTGPNKLFTREEYLAHANARFDPNQNFTDFGEYWEFLQDLQNLGMSVEEWNSHS